MQKIKENDRTVEAVRERERERERDCPAISY